MGCSFFNSTAITDGYDVISRLSFLSEVFFSASEPDFFLSLISSINTIPDDNDAAECLTNYCLS